MDLFTDQKVVQKDGKERNAIEVITNKIVGIYFAAKWCPSCRKFTSVLKEFYNELSKRKAPFEIIFVSFDKKKEEMDSFVQELHGNWWILKFENNLKQELREKYEIDVVPKLLILSSTGNVITKRGRKELEDRGVAAFRSWLTSAGVTSARIKTPDFTKEEIILDKGSVKETEEKRVKIVTE